MNAISHDHAKVSSGSLRTRLLRGLCGLALLGAAAAPGPAQADSLGEGARQLAAGLAEAMRADGLGQAQPAALYLRAPTDDRLGTVCRPLSSKIRQSLAGAMKDAFGGAGLAQARVVILPGMAPGELTASTVWRDTGDDGLEVLLQVSDPAANPPTWLHSGTAQIRIEDLSVFQRECLYEPQMVEEDRSAGKRMAVYRDYRNLSRELAEVPKGAPYRMVARIPGRDMPWAIIRLQHLAEDNPLAGTLGYALIREDTAAPTETSDTGEAAAEVTLFASHVVDFSAQYNDGGWSAQQVLGPPTINECGDREGSWTTSGTGEQYIQVAFERPLEASALHVYQNYEVGFVRGLVLWGPNGEQHGLVADDRLQECPGISVFELPPVGFPVLSVTVVVDADHGSYEEIDAIALVGR